MVKIKRLKNKNMHDLRIKIKTKKDAHLGILTLFTGEGEVSQTDSKKWVWDLEDALETFEHDETIWVVLVTSELDTFLPDQIVLGSRSLGEILDNITKPIICSVQRNAFDLGFEFMMSCDISVCRDTSQFSIGHLKKGDIPRDGGTQRLPRIVGQGRALELLLTGRTFDASEAKEIGLVQYVSCCDSLDLGVDVAHRIISNAPISVKYIKESVKSGLDMTLNQGLVLEADLSLILQSTEDRSEGLGSFFDKRKPKFKGQ